MTGMGVGGPPPHDEVPLRLHDEVPLLLKSVIAEDENLLALDEQAQQLTHESEN